ncbi:hypothetical protein EC968_001018 [Mortierella alpina]|nr:hypothetical protein EC968_001018 [Mortierella alpina]
MSDPSTELSSASITLSTACLSIDSSVDTVLTSADHAHHEDGKTPQHPEPAMTSRNPQQSLSEDPTSHGHSQKGSEPDARSTDAHAPTDAWAGQGHFPLLLGAVSRLSVPLRGGARIVLTGMNFRKGVQVVFACPQLEGSLGPKVVTPKVLKSTELEFLSPCLLDWWALLNRTEAAPVLKLSVSLVCAGSKDTSDVDTAFEMIAIEDSETELLHVIIALHRQLIQATLTSNADIETERNSRQKTLTLLSLEQPPSVTRSEHLALGVMYMLGDECDMITQEGMKVLQATTEDGHDMLHLAVILNLPTLVREITRHLLARYKTLPMTAECNIFAEDPNGQTRFGEYSVCSAGIQGFSIRRRTRFASHTAREESHQKHRCWIRVLHWKRPQPSFVMYNGGIK